MVSPPEMAPRPSPLESPVPSIDLPPLPSLQLMTSNLPAGVALSSHEVLPPFYEQISAAYPEVTPPLSPEGAASTRLNGLSPPDPEGSAQSVYEAVPPSLAQVPSTETALLSKPEAIPRSFFGTSRFSQEESATSRFEVNPRSYPEENLPSDPETNSPSFMDEIPPSYPETILSSHSEADRPPYPEAESSSYSEAGSPSFPEAESSASYNAPASLSFEMESRPYLETEAASNSDVDPYSKPDVLTPTYPQESDSSVIYMLNSEIPPLPNHERTSLINSEGTSQLYSEVAPIPFPKRISTPLHVNIERKPYSRLERPANSRVDSLPYPRMEAPLYAKVEAIPHPTMDTPPNSSLDPPFYPRMEPPSYPEMVASHYPIVDAPLNPKLEPVAYSKVKAVSYAEVGSHPKSKRPLIPEELPPTHPEMATHYEKTYPHFTTVKQRLDDSYPNHAIKVESHGDTPSQQYKQPCLPGWTYYHYLSSCYQFFPKVKVTWLEAEVRQKHNPDRLFLIIVGVWC